MRRNVCCSLLFLGVVLAARAQPGPARPNQPKTSTKGGQPAKPRQARPKYLTVAFDLNQTNLGVNFAGHDITAVVQAIDDSPALQEKSEFETSAAYSARQGGFIDHSLFGSVKPTDRLAFVVEGSLSHRPSFEYNADSRMWVLSLMDKTNATVGSDEPPMDRILIRTTVTDRDSYIGTNAFGASMKVDRTYSEDFGVAFAPDMWVFASRGLSRMFKHRLAMGPEEAREFKPDAQLLFVCHLIQPWMGYSVSGHDPTFSQPHETLVGESYLQVVPEELWVFNSRTGEVIQKYSSSLGRDDLPTFSLPQVIQEFQ